MAPHFGNNGQLSRDERVQLYGIDCDDQVMWHDWQPGVESVQDLVLQNVALVTQKVKFKLPPSKEFDMPYPEPFKLAPGMKKSIPISFRPSRYEPHVDKVQIITKGGSFFITVKAVVKDVALTVPHFLDFGLCPTMERSEQQIEVYNTGTLRASMKWHARPPFTVRCPTDVIEVGQAVRCTVEFEPSTASVFDALLACEATNATRNRIADDGDDTASPEAKQYYLQATGVGKLPHLCVPNSRTPIVEFGSVTPGSRSPKTIELLNTTPVRATFRVQALHESGEVAPLPPLPFFVTPETGVVEPNCTFTITFHFQSHTVKEHACQRFQVTTPGGTPLVVTCKAYCKPIEVRLSTRSINYGEVKCGKVYSRTIQLHNDSDRPAPYHFINADYMKGIFWLDRHIGVIPPDSFMVVTVFFGPLAPINYHKEVSCVIKGASAPLILHLLGSAHTEKARPARLDQHHIDIFRNLQLSGVREHQIEERNPQDAHEDEDLPMETLEPMIPEVPVKPRSATASFLELMLPTDSKLRDITISPGNLDFGPCSVLTLSEKHTVTITNRTSQKVTVYWMLSGETRMPCTAGDEKGLFSVYPVTCDIKPRGSADFQIAFRPQSNSTVEGEILEVLVMQKVNRTFRLVDLQRFTPPWMLSIRSMGNTMGGARNDPQVDISESHIRFRPCHPGERTYQIAMLTNPGDVCLSYQILPATDASATDFSAATLKDLHQDAPFRAWPTQGIILPHQFHLIVLEFAPTAAKNEVAYVANISVVVDYNESQPKFIRVSGRAWKPQLAFCKGASTVTFPPTCAGIASTMLCTVKNVSEIPISYECRIPTRFRSTFWFTEPNGQLAPSESVHIPAFFSPSAERVFSAPLYCASRCVEDPDNYVEGPLRALMSKASDKDDDTSYVLQLVGHGKGPALSLEPEELDLGAVKACEDVKNEVVILNSSNLAVHYVVEAIFVGTDPCAAAVAESCLTLSQSEGCVEGRCTDTLSINFCPPCRGEFVYQITVTAKGDGARTPDGRAITLTFRAIVQYPFIQIADLRTESSTLQPQSMMWTQFQVDGINKLYQGEVTEVERLFQAAIGIDEKKQAVRQLKPFQLLFGTAAAGSGPTIVYLVLSNPSRLGIRFSFQTPKNLNLENAPYWCDEKALIDDRDAHFGWVEEHGIYDIQPRSGEIAPGDFLHVKLTYHHHSIGTHILPVVFNVLDGRSVLLYLKAQSVAPNVGCLSVRSSLVELQPVPLGLERGVVQPVELTNSGAALAPWRIDPKSILDFNLENHDFEVLSVAPIEGILDPESSTFLHFSFTPLEAKRYSCPIRIEMLKDGVPTEELCFELRADGFMPNTEKPKVDDYFPLTLPLQTFAPIPNAGAALSIEVLDFDTVPLRARTSQMLILVNYTSEFVLNFQWDDRRLFRSPLELEIEPRTGELSPGSHCIVVFRLCSEDPLDISGEVACHLGWTHLSGYGQNSVMESIEDQRPKFEYLAFHKDHIHEPMKSGKNAGEGQVHISVANRLTVSRFRHLMSTAAGQKFLNENLHRTSVLSSHIPSMSPRRAMQASTMGRTLQSKEELPGANKSMSLIETSALGPASPSPPSLFPLYVRLRAIVGDWCVPESKRDEFLIQSPARALVARQDAEEMEADATMPRKLSEDNFSQQRLSPKRIDKPSPFAVTTPSLAAKRARLPRGQLGPELVSGVFDHVLREVMAEKDFQSILDKMLFQDTPHFLQYEDSLPPNLPEPDLPAEAKTALLTDLREGGGLKDEEADVADEESDDENVQDPFIELMKAKMAQSAKPQRSDLLFDFEEPLMAGSISAVVSPSSPQVPTLRSAHSSIEESSELQATAESSWQEALDHFGEVDLDAFKDSAGEVLDKLLLDMMDDVIAGRLNWMRPLPRSRSKSKRSTRQL